MASLLPGSASGPGGSGPLSAPAIVNYQQQPPPQQQQQQHRDREQKEMQSFNNYSLSDSGNHAPSGLNPSAAAGPGGGAGAGAAAAAAAGPTQLDKFAAIKTYVESEWTAKDRKDSRSHAQKLWKQYHSAAARAAGKDSSAYLSLDELTELTKDSLSTLHSHMHLFINSMYEDMKKTTQICMINLMQRYRYSVPHQSHSAQTSLNHHGHAGGPAGGGGMGGGRGDVGMGGGGGGGGGGNTLSVGGGGGATMNLNDIEWLNTQIESEKKTIMQVLNTQIEEWIEHYVDVAEALFNKMVSAGKGAHRRPTHCDDGGSSHRNDARTRACRGGRMCRANVDLHFVTHSCALLPVCVPRFFCVVRAPPFVQDVKRDGKITKSQFADHFGGAIYEVRTNRRLNWTGQAARQASWQAGGSDHRSHACSSDLCCRIADRSLHCARTHSDLCSRSGCVVAPSLSPLHRSLVLISSASICRLWDPPTSEQSDQWIADCDCPATQPARMHTRHLQWPLGSRCECYLSPTLQRLFNASCAKARSENSKNFLQKPQKLWKRPAR